MSAHVEILICMGTSKLSKIITSVTGDKVTHVGILVTLRGKRYVLEAVDSIRLVPLDWYLTNSENSGEPYDGDMIIGNLKLPNKRALNKFLDYAFDQLGRDYDWDDLFKIWYNKSWFGKWFGGFKHTDDKKLYCSELIMECLEAATGTKPPGHILPADIALMCKKHRRI